MKYTIEGFNQKAAMNITAEKDGKTLKLDCTDLIILRFFVDFYPNMTKKTINNKEYAWVRYDYILEQMPLLNIGKRSLMERFKKLVDLKVLSHITFTENGTFSYYGFGENYSLLISDYEQECRETISEGMKNISQGMKNIAEGVNNFAYPCEENFIPSVKNSSHPCEENFTPPVKNSSHQNNSSIIDSSINSSIKDSSVKKTDSCVREKNLEEEFEKIWAEYPKKEGKKNALKAYIRARKSGTSQETILNGLSAYLKKIRTENTEPRYIKHGSSWFTQECWLDDYSAKKDFTETPKVKDENGFYPDGFDF